jgi:hypothetical protein
VKRTQAGLAYERGQVVSPEGTFPGRRTFSSISQRQIETCARRASLGRWLALLAVWILTWTVIFSALDFWTIKIYNVPRYRWFEEYRTAVRYSAVLISPASFALAENAYFVWMNTYDPHYHMHEWEWYTGDPVNPDGYYNFVWGNGQGGWVRFPMKIWYGGWLLITVPWLAVVSLVFFKWPRASALNAPMELEADKQSLNAWRGPHRAPPV